MDTFTPGRYSLLEWILLLPVDTVFWNGYFYCW